MIVPDVDAVGGTQTGAFDWGPNRLYPCRIGTECLPDSGMKDNTQRVPARAIGWVLAVLWLVVASAGFHAAHAVDSAVVIMYHRFGENAYPSTNIRLAQFEAHLKELTSGPYMVLPLNTVVDALKSGKLLPDRTVAITIDDAYRSVFTQAWPRLRAAGLTFTLFVATEPVTKAFPDYMTWA